MISMLQSAGFDDAAATRACKQAAGQPRPSADKTRIRERYRGDIAKMINARCYQGLFISGWLLRS